MKARCTVITDECYNAAHGGQSIRHTPEIIYKILCPFKTLTSISKRNERPWGGGGSEPAISIFWF